MRPNNLICILLIAALLLSLPLPSAWSKEPARPDYLENANTQVANASSVGGKYAELADDILIARNALRTANSEYEKNLGTFSGKLDPKAESTVRQLADMAILQAALVSAKAGAIYQDKERIRLEGLILDTKAKIKVFDDLAAKVKALKTQTADQVSQIASLNAKVASLDAELSAKGSAITSSDQKTAELLKALEEQKKATASSEQRVSALSQELEGLKQQMAKLQTTSEQLSAERRLKAFEADVGKLGGIVKATATGLTITLPRSRMLKVTGKSTTLTVDGDSTLSKVADLIKTYPEYHIKIRVHGFGQPTRSEDASATDQMARFMREALLTKGKFEPSMVEALGIGAAEPIFPKKNVEGNRRVEFIFVKK